MKQKRIGLLLVITLAGHLFFRNPCEVCGQDTKTDALQKECREKAIKWLRETGQNPQDGSFSAEYGPGVTAIVATGLMKSGLPASDAMVSKSLEYLKGFVKPDGGIYAPESMYANYETSLAILCFAEANAGGEYDKLIDDAEAYIKRNQWGGEVNPAEPSDTRFGGFGYGKYGRPDLSNTSFTIEALLAAGNDENSEAIQRAIAFVSRTQNFPSEHNTTAIAKKNPDGGFFYSPAGEGESKADKTEDGGLRSYASMTYAGLKSFLYAGVSKDDPRVGAAVEWIRRNYDLDTNPGMGAQGLYYYYHVFAKALAHFGEDQFADHEGAKHDWRQELVAELASRQNPDGYWTNTESDRWLESDPCLVTGYALLSLAWCGNSE